MDVDSVKMPWWAIVNCETQAARVCGAPVVRNEPFGTYFFQICLY